VKTTSAVARWWMFVRERYEPTTHLVMAASFALGNAAVVWLAVGLPGRGGSAAGSIVFAFVFFLRLRVLDEIKDYEADRTAHPGRPLPRGLVSLSEARRVAWLLVLGEVMIVAAVEPRALVAWLLLLAYSLGMSVEFGVGTWLRPRLELYAMSHTLVAGFLGLTIASLGSGVPLHQLPATSWIFAAANWAVFNVFEFSRKTFAPEEERDGVPSYSGRLGVRGATLLSLVWTGLALAVSWLVVFPDMRAPAWMGVTALALGAVAVTLPYQVRPRGGTAHLFRHGMAVWTMLLYGSLVSAHLWVPS
jgi:4-hydroxybenzoate polyprenyltransferase